LVGITVLTKTALRAYEIGDAYRKKGIPVVLGGIHPRPFLRRPKNMPIQSPSERPKKYGPTLSKMSGWEISSPFTAKRLHRIIKIPIPRREILPQRGYLPLDVVQVTRGCPFHCEFCSVQNFFGETYRSGPSRMWSKRCAAYVIGG